MTGGGILPVLTPQQQSGGRRKSTYLKLRGKTARRKFAQSSMNTYENRHDISGIPSINRGSQRRRWLIEPAVQSFKIEGEIEGRRRGWRWRLTPRHQHIQVILLSTPDVNAGPRRRARMRYVSAARPLAFVCHFDVWGGVPTSLPIPDRNRSRTQREQWG